MDCNPIIQIASQDTNSAASAVTFFSYYGPFISALIGGLVAGGFALLGVHLAHKKDEQRQQKAKDTEIMAFCQAIHTEVESAWATYIEGIGSRIESLPDDDPMLLVTTLKQNPFPVYHSMIHLVGMLANEELRRKIIYTYSIWQSQIEAFSRHSDEVKNYNQLKWEINISSNKIERKQRADAHFDILVKHADNIKKLHKDLKQSVNVLLQSLKDMFS